MALGPREFVEEVEKFFDIIEQRKNAKKNIFGKPSARRIKFGQVDLADIKNDLLEISVALQRLYITQQSINNMSSWDTVKVLKKARIIALASVCQIFNEYSNKSEMNFWQFYSQEAGVTINSNFYEKILEPALSDEGIISPNSRLIDTFTSIISKEADLSGDILEDILSIFSVYCRYFYPNFEITDFLKDIELKDKSIVMAMLPKNYPEKNILLDSFGRVYEFKERVKWVLEDLISFTNFCNNKDIPLSYENLDQLIVDYNNDYKYEINYIFKNDELKNRYIKFLPSVYPYKFLSILKKEDPHAVIVLPDNRMTSVDEVLGMEEIMYGTYIIDDKKYNVLPNQALDINHFSNIDRDKIVVHGNKVIIRSFHPFIPYIGISKAIKKPLKFFKNEKFEGYLWYANKPLIETLTIKSEKVPILPLESSEKIISDLFLKLVDSDVNPKFKLELAYLLLISHENKNKKVDIISTDQTSIFRDFSVDGNGVGFSGQISYPVKTKKAGKIDLFLVSNNEPLSLREFVPGLSCEMDETMLFDGKLFTRIFPSQRLIESTHSKLYLFTVRNFENKWVNNVCEVSSYQNFGSFNVYEIDWIDKNNSLEINIDNDYRWSFARAIDINVEPRETGYSNKFIDFKKNQFLSMKDVNLIISCADPDFQIKDIDIKTSVNFDIVSSQMRIGTINNLLERNENHPVLDELFIRNLLHSASEISYGRYDFEFSYRSSVIARIEIFIIPELSVDEGNDVYIEGEDLVLTLTSNVPCFRNRKLSQNYLFDKPARCNFALSSNKLIENKKPEYFKKARLYHPYTELDLKYEPEIIGYRFIQEGRLYSADIVDFYNLDRTSIAVKASQREVRLKVNNNVVKPMVPNNMGIIIEPLKSVKDYLSRPSNDVSFQMGKHEVSFQVLWNPKVTKIISENMLYSPEEGITFFISYEGPTNSYLKLFITDESAKNLEVKKIICGEDPAPKFVRYDRHKNCIFITCDGRRWEERVFKIHLVPEAIANLEYIHLRGEYEYNHASFGEIVFKNEKLEPEIQTLSMKIRKDPKNPYSYFERGFLYSEINHFLMADRDFNKSLELGLDDEEAMNYIELFKASLANNLLAYELSQITNLARKLYTEELLLDVE